MTRSGKLSEEQVAEFHRAGWIGPFDLGCSQVTLEKARRAAREYSSTKVNPIYELVLGRDLHLFHGAIYALFDRPEIREKLVQLLGPDLLLWRSDVFPKPAGAPATPWHQANNFLEFSDHPLLESPGNPPDDWTRLWQLTVWVALEDATPENGCLEVIPGTHTARLTWPLHGEEARKYLEEKESRAGDPPSYFVKQDPVIDELLPTKKVLEAKAGQFYIFTQRVVHGSGPNTTDRSRLAVNCRIIQSDVKCYRWFLEQGRWEMLGVSLPLHNWGCIRYAGELTGEPVNPILPPPTGGLSPGWQSTEA